MSWRCPECSSQNDDSLTKCICGYFLTESVNSDNAVANFDNSLTGKLAKTPNLEESISIENQDNLITKLFRGDVSLPITYWVFNVFIGNIFFLICFKIIESNYINIVSSTAGEWLILGFYWFVIGYSIFILIAIWRSAGKYQGRTIWSALARMSVIIGFLGLITNGITGFQQGNNTDFALNEQLTLLNNSLPKMIDDITRLDYISVQDKDVYYNYTIVDRTVAEMDVSRFTSKMTPMLIAGNCANKESRSLLDEERKLVHVYRDKINKPISKIVIEKSDCLFPAETTQQEPNSDETKPKTLANYKPSELFSQNTEAIVLIRIYDESGNLTGFGSGFNVHENGVILTNRHVVLSGGSYLDIKFPKHGLYEDVYIAGISDSTTDITVLRIDGKELPKVNDSPSVPVKVGDRIYTISNPEGLLNTLSEGLVSAERVVDNTTFFQITAPISKGSSGGAVFNELGEVIGIATMIMKEGQNLNFAVSIDEFSKIEAFEEYFTLKELMAYLTRQKEKTINQDSHLNWSNNPGAYELHLKRRHNNMLFQKKRRVINQSEVDFARNHDHSDYINLKNRLSNLLIEVEKFPDIVDSSQINKIREIIDTLIGDAVGVGGEAELIVQKTKEFRKLLITTWSESAANNPKAKQAIIKAENFYQENIIKFEVPFVAQITRENSPIPDDELIPALLMESPDVITKTFDWLDPDTRTIIQKEAIRILKSAVNEGAQIKNFNDILNALKINNEN